MWTDNKKEGVGVWTNTNGDVYEGIWHNDKRFGKGKQVSKEGKMTKPFERERERAKSFDRFHFHLQISFFNAPRCVVALAMMASGSTIVQRDMVY
jgi:hypothetical protein